MWWQHTAHFQFVLNALHRHTYHGRGSCDVMKKWNTQANVYIRGKRKRRRKGLGEQGERILNILQYILPMCLMCPTGTMWCYIHFSINIYTTHRWDTLAGASRVFDTHSHRLTKCHWDQEGTTSLMQTHEKTWLSKHTGWGHTGRINQSKGKGHEDMKGSASSVLDRDVKN